MKIAFVCLGNICRSPLAEAIAKDYIKKYNLDIYIESLGTGNYHIGEPPCTNSQIVAKNHSLDISKYKASQFTKKDISRFDIVVGLDCSNVSNLKKVGVTSPLLLGDYGFNGEDVPDPYFFKGFEGFEKVYSMIETCVINLLQSLSSHNKL